MAYSTGYYTPDFTGQYGTYDFNIVKVWLPDPSRYPVQPSAPYKVFVSTQDNKECRRFDITTTGAQENIWFADPLEYQFLEDGWAVAMIGFDGTRTGLSADFQTDTVSKGRFFWHGHDNGAWEQEDYTTAHKDFARGVQYLKSHSNSGMGASDAILKKNGFVAYGNGTAGQAIQYSCLHSDMQVSGASDYTAESTRLKGMFLVNSMSEFQVMRNSTAIADQLKFFPDDDLIASTGLVTVMSSVTEEYELEASSLYYGFRDAAVIDDNSEGIGVVWYSTGDEQTTTVTLDFTGVDTSSTFKYSSSKNKLITLDETDKLGINDPWHGAILMKRLRDVSKNGWHQAHSFWLSDNTVATGAAGLGWDISPDFQFDGDSIPELYSMYQFVLNWANNLLDPPDNLPDYYLDVYGDAAIAWVPPVVNYDYNSNNYKRGQNDRTFRWEEVQIPLTFAQTGAILNYVMPDEYVIQVTPDLGWHDQLSMLGDPGYTDGRNPHLKSIGPLSVSNGRLTNNVDGSVQYDLSLEEWQSVIIDGYDKYIWRAVPWGDGNPGLGGLPQKFQNISTYDQLKFSVDDFIQETKKAVQVISGKKSKRASISITSSNVSSTVIDQTDTTWKVSFIIDRPNVKFTIVATDTGGTAVGKHVVDIDYESFGQYQTHLWNTFDSFASMAGMTRLPDETNVELKARTLDSYKNKGGSHYNGLISSINREVGLSRFDDSIRIKRAVNTYGKSYEDTVFIESNHTRMSVSAPSMSINDEVRRVDDYFQVLKMGFRIKDVVSIKTQADVVVPTDKWEVTDHVDGNEIWIDPAYTGDLKVSYLYKEDISYSQYSVVAAVVAKLNTVVNPNGLPVVVATMNEKMGGHERSTYLYKSFGTINIDNGILDIGWSRIGLFKISDEEYKWSFADENSMFFNSEFYQFILELKSVTNIEWGFVVADEDFWDAVDADQYGRDSLPIALDPDIAHFVTAVPIRANDSIHFDPWEAYSMGYYFENSAIKNVGFPREAFRSGVGFRKDCAVTVETINISSDKVVINHNAIAVKVEDTLVVDAIDVQDIIIDI